MRKLEMLEQKEIKLNVFRNHFGATEEQVEKFVKEFEAEDGYELISWTCGIDEVENMFERILEEDC